MKALIPLFLSVVTVGQMWLVGDRKAVGWAIGLLNQVAWLVFIVMFSAWGLLVLNGFLVVTYTRNLVKWTIESIDASADRLTIGPGYL